MSIMNPFDADWLDLVPVKPTKTDDTWQRQLAPGAACNCYQPLLLYIPPGETVTLHCPVHGPRTIKGSGVTC